MDAGWPLALVVCVSMAACSRPVPHAASGQSAGSPGGAGSEPLISFTASTSWGVSEKHDPDGHVLATAQSKSMPDCRATIDTWVSLPPSPGGMMSVASTRDLTLDGVPLRIAKTSVFADQAEAVEVAFVDDGRAYGRIVLRNCTMSEANAALEQVRFSSSLKRKSDR